MTGISLDPACLSFVDQFELTIVLPPSPFAPKGGPALAIVLPVSSRELVRDLKLVVTESPEGFWLGAFSLVRADDDDETPLGEWDEIGNAFEDDADAEPTAPKSIKVVDGACQPLRPALARCRCLANR
jgi:hypothetical protein